ncbi:VOC family protein [Aestuariicoccus sp. MJ-SS9]|uniref:VOC family protein n=1 Tax=Aestuariicoccus sp. MJ-SS9 TaxID=3079855 RepID=UPI002912B940|nr:VOC family protein [Aestuariicoccus sp. MJ-SS9]MDU8909755.1 VOC family protein [Aestuariicoccus sp. MJ-SS9]
MIPLDNGRLGGCWFAVKNKTCDLACSEEHGGGRGRLHYVTYATDLREDILRAADLFLEAGVHIETGPDRHAIQGTFFRRVREPAGNWVELANAGARLILAPACRLDRGGPQDGSGLGAQDHRQLSHPRVTARDTAGQTARRMI